MINITTWLDEFLYKLDTTFGTRLWFVGLQGSHARGEATESSDIDPVVILDQVTPEDIAVYGSLLDTLPAREKICGFFSGREALLSWDPADLFRFYYDTQPIRGSLDVLLPLLDEGAVKRAILVGAGNLYHGCVHNMLHEKSDNILRGLYKGAVFTAQAVCYLQTGRYIHRHRDLMNWATGNTREIVSTALTLKEGGAVRFQEMSHLLFHWTQSLIINK